MPMLNHLLVAESGTLAHVLFSVAHSTGEDGRVPLLELECFAKVQQPSFSGDFGDPLQGKSPTSRKI